MLRWVSFFVAVLGVGASSVSGQEKTVGQSKPEKNLVQDASLEGRIGENGLPDAWRGFGEQPESSYQARVVNTGRTGKKSLQIEGDGQYGVVSTNFVRIKGKTRYRARGWVKIDGAPEAAADVKFHYFDANQRYLGQTRIPFVSPPTKDWTFIEVTDRINEWPKAEWIQVAVALAGKGRASFDDLELTAHAADQLPDDFDLSPELKPLNRLVGTWNVEVLYQPAVWTPDGSRKTETKVCRWILGNKFLEETRRAEKPKTGEHRALFGYDSQSKLLRSWYFDTNGSAFVSNGSWNEANGTLTWESVIREGITAKSTHHFRDPDTIEYTFSAKDENGKVMLDAKAIHRRVKNSRATGK